MASHPHRPGEESPQLDRDDRWVSDALGVSGVIAWQWEAATGRVASVEPDGPRTLDELVARIHEDDRESWWAAFRRACDAGERWSCSLRLAPNGTGISWVEERGRAWLDGDGRPARAVATQVDVAPCPLRQPAAPASCGEGRRAVGSGASAAGPGPLQRPEGLLDAVLDSMDDGVLLITADGRITRASRRARELLRCDGAPLASIEELLGNARALDGRGNPVPSTQPAWALALRGDSTRSTAFVMQLAGGRRICISAGAAPIRARDGTILGAVLTIADRAHAPGAFEGLARMISQDLRPLLGAIVVQAKLLGRRSEGLQALRSRTDAIVSSAQRMGATLDDLVESVLLEGGRLRLELVPVDLLEMVTAVRRQLPAAYDREQIRIEPCRELPRVLADPNRLERVIVNLLTGALKRSPPKAQVVARLAHDADEVVLGIEDHGEPIDCAPPHAVGPPARMPAPGREDHALELYTCRVVVEAHGGAMGVDAAAPRGNVVRVRLPLRPPGTA